MACWIKRLRELGMHRGNWEREIGGRDLDARFARDKHIVRAIDDRQRVDLQTRIYLRIEMISV